MNSQGETAREAGRYRLFWETLACALALTASIRLADAQPRIRLATQAPKGGSVHAALLDLADKLRHAPCGGVNFISYTDGTMGDEAEIVRRIRVDQVQAALLTITGLEQIDESVTSLQLMPMMFRDLDEVHYVRDKLTPRITQRFQDKGFVVLGWGDAGWVRYFSRAPLLHPADLKRMKIFVWTGDSRQADLMKSMGYQVVVLDIGSALTGFQTGMINVMATIPYHALSAQLYGPAKHMLELNWVPLVGALVVSRKAWDGLCPEARESLASDGHEALEQISATAYQEGARSVEAMKSRHGLIVHPVTPEMDTEWRRSAEEVYPKIRGNLVPADMFDEVQRLLRDYRAGDRTVIPGNPAVSPKPGRAGEGKKP